MDEKKRLLLRTAVLLTLGLLCWGTALCAGGADSAASGTAQPEPSVLSVLAETDAAPDSVEEPSAAPALTEEQAQQLAVCLAEAGTPFFTDPAALTAAQIEEAALWWGMEQGMMPSAAWGTVTLPAEQLLAWAEKLFGRAELVPSDCALAEYDPEQDAFLLPAAAIRPAYYPVLSAAVQTDGETRLEVSLLSADGWEGDVLGNLYRPEQLARAVLVLRDGVLSGWLSM